MKKCMLFIFILILSVILLSNSIAAGFKDDYDAIEEATKSVLKIFVYENVDDDVLDYASNGSGFVAFNSSTMITNYHVIDDAARVVALDDDNNVYELDRILCADKDADIAILKFTMPSSLKPLELYPDNQLKRGAPVVAIGSPKELKNTVSTGIVSYVYDDGIPEIQITAPISPGSSGGALFNDNGKVIGVTSSGYQSKDEYGENTDAQNINFAVNIAVAQAMYNAWDGSTYSFTSFPSTAKMDFTDVYKHEPEVTTQPSDQPVIIEAESTGTWICINCGAENTTKFCQECGAEKPVWICSCGKINSSNKFCGECGKSYAELIAAFDEAVEKAKQLDYEGAVEILEDLGSFNSGSFETAAGTHADAQSYVGKTYYDQGLYLQENGGDHDAILKSFEKAGTYGDAQEQIAGENARFAKLNYDAGIEQLNNGEYLSAIESFKAAGEFQDAAEKILEVYYAWGQNLLENKNYEESREKFKLAGEYGNASDMVYGTYYVEAEECLKNLDYENALSLFEKAGDYLDAKEKAAEIENNQKEIMYQSAMAAYESQDYTLAKELFAGISGYKDADEFCTNAEIMGIKMALDKQLDPASMEDLDKYERKLDEYKDNTTAKELIKQINYLRGMHQLYADDSLNAVTYFRLADDYADAKQKLYDTSMATINKLIEAGSYTAALDFYEKEFVSYGITADIVLANVNDKNDVVSEVLGLVKALLPNSEKIPKKEDTYKESYEPLVVETKEYFGMKNDGKISLEEYYEIHNLVYLGSNGSRVESLLEKLADLGYFQKLPDSHDTFENRYLNGIKKAEKEFVLQEDGIITRNEYDAIMEKEVSIPDAPTKLNITVKDDTVTLSWPKVEGAFFYEVSSSDSYSNFIKYSSLGTTEKTNWTDKDVFTGQGMCYRVQAKKYTVTGRPKVEYISIPAYYVNLTVEKLNKEYTTYVGKFVRLNNLSINKWERLYRDGKQDVEQDGEQQTERGFFSVLQSKLQGFDYDVCLYCESGNSSVRLIITDYVARRSNSGVDLLSIIDKEKGSLHISVTGKVIETDGDDSPLLNGPCVEIDSIKRSNR